MSHSLQANNFSAVWERMCLLRSLDLENVLSHWLQTNDFPSESERARLLTSLEAGKALLPRVYNNSISAASIVYLQCSPTEGIVTMCADKQVLARRGHVVILKFT